MKSNLDRREFVQTAMTSIAAGGILTASQAMAADEPKQPLYKVSVAEWSLHNAIFGKQLDNLDFPKVVRERFDLDAVEWVNQFFKDRATDSKYLDEMNKRCADQGVRSLLIMVDGEGHLGDPDDQRRTEAVENHYRWIEACKHLGCHSVRVNAASDASLPYEEQQKLAADGLRRLSEWAANYDLNVIVENHGGLSSNGKWLSGVMKLVDLANCGTLPDFGNFRVSEGDWYDRYQGVAELMPYAKAVSAKSHEFDAQGNEVRTDYAKMMKIVVDAGYHGYVGIEWEGSEPSEYDGIRLTRDLLFRVRDALSAPAGP